MKLFKRKEEEEIYIIDWNKVNTLEDMVLAMQLMQKAIGRYRYYNLHPDFEKICKKIKE